jgi:hypothetical protein
VQLAGDDWVGKLYKAAIALSPNESDMSPVGTELLQDIRLIFTEKNIALISTSVLIEALCVDEESRWVVYNYRSKDSKITARQISKLLKEYNICSKNIRYERQVVKGYEKKQFEDAWARYVINIPIKSTPEIPATTLQTPAKSITESFLSVADILNVATTNHSVADNSNASTENYLVTTELNVTDENYSVTNTEIISATKRSVADILKLSATPRSLIETGTEGFCSVVADNLDSLSESTLFIEESEKYQKNEQRSWNMMPIFHVTGQKRLPKLK